METQLNNQHITCAADTAFIIGRFAYVPAGMVAVMFNAARMPVEEAYAVIPHQHTGFNRLDPGIDAQEAVGLDALFAMVNTAIVLKVEILNRLAGHGKAGRSLAEYPAAFDALVAELQQPAVPDRLHQVRKLLTASPQQQSDYFHDWIRRSTAGEPFSFRAADARVVAAHRDLVTG